MSDRFAQYPSLAERRLNGCLHRRAFLRAARDVTFVDIDEAASTALCARIRDAGLRAPRFIACDLRDIAALQRSRARGLGCNIRHQFFAAQR